MTTKALLHFDASPFVDEVGNTVTSTGSMFFETGANKKFGTGGVEFGTGGRVSLPSSVLDTSLDWTVEGFFKQADTSTKQVIFSFGNEATGRMAFFFGSGAGGQVTLENSSGTVVKTFGARPTAFQFNHIAFVRSGNDIYCFVNGTQLGTVYSASSGAFGNSGGFFMGSLSNGNNTLVYYLDEVRFTQSALYTSNFTAPTAAFTYSSQLDVSLTAGTTQAIAITGRQATPAVPVNARPPAAYFDPARASPDLYLGPTSNPFKNDVYCNAAGVAQGSIGVTNTAAGQDRSFIISVGTLTGNINIGLATNTISLEDDLFPDASTKLGMRQNGVVYDPSFNVLADLGTPAAGMDIQIRLKNGKVYFRRATGGGGYSARAYTWGPWNGSTVNANPDTGAGGIDVTGFAGALYPTIYMDGGAAGVNGDHVYMIAEEWADNYTQNLTATGLQGAAQMDLSVSVAGGAGALTITGRQGTVSGTSIIDGGLGTLAITGFAASAGVVIPADVTGNVGALAITGFAGSAVAAINVDVTGGLGGSTNGTYSYTTGSGTWSAPADTLTVSSVSTVAGNVSTVRFYANSGAGNARAVVFSAGSDGKPQNLIAQSNDLIVNTAGWQTFTFATPVSFVSGLTHWVGLHSDAGGIVWRNDNTSTGSYYNASTGDDWTGGTATTWTGGHNDAARLHMEIAYEGSGVGITSYAGTTAVTNNIPVTGGPDTLAIQGFSGSISCDILLSFPSAGFNPDRTGLGITLSNGNQTATVDVTANGIVQGAIGQPCGAVGQDFTWTYTIDTWGDVQHVGLATSTIPLADGLDFFNGTTTVAMRQDGNVYQAGTFTVFASLGQPDDGDVIEVRLKNGKVYFRRKPFGGSFAPWNGASFAADPDTDTGGLDVTGYTGDLFPSVYLGTNGASGTADFTAWGGAQPQRLSVTGHEGGVGLATTGGVTALTITGYPASITDDPSILGEAGALTITGFAGGVGNVINITGSAGTLAFAGHAATVYAQASHAITGGHGLVMLSGLQGALGNDYEIDFISGVATGVALSDFTVAQPATLLAPKSDGAYQSFNPHTLRITDLGLSIDPRTRTILSRYSLTPSQWATYANAWSNSTYTVDGQSVILTTDNGADGALYPNLSRATAASEQVVLKARVQTVAGNFNTGARIVRRYGGNVDVVATCADITVERPVWNTFLGAVRLASRKLPDGSNELVLAAQADSASDTRFGVSVITDGTASKLRVHGLQVSTGQEEIGWHNNGNAGALITGDSVTMSGAAARPLTNVEGSIVIEVEGVGLAWANPGVFAHLPYGSVLHAGSTELLKISGFTSISSGSTTAAAGMGGFRGVARIGLRRTGSGFAICVNGGAVATSSTPLTIDGAIKLFAGGLPVRVRKINGYGTALSDADLRASTAITNREFPNLSGVLVPGETAISFEDDFGVNSIRTRSGDPTVSPIANDNQSMVALYGGSQPGKYWMPRYVHATQNATGTGYNNINAEYAHFADPQYPGNYNPFEFSNGTLKIVAQKTSALSTAQQSLVPNRHVDGVDTGVQFPFVSGSLVTAPVFNQKGGYFEMRAKLPSASKSWPAFWLLPNTLGSETELDVVEHIGDSAFRTTSAAHAGSYAWNVGIDHREPYVWAADWHTYGALWKVGEGVTYFRDGEKIGFISTVGTNFDDYPMYLLINLAIGGGWPGTPDQATYDSMPVTMEVDYVRAYNVIINASADAAGGTPLGFTTYPASIVSTASPVGILGVLNIGKLAGGVSASVAQTAAAAAALAFAGGTADVSVNGTVASGGLDTLAIEALAGTAAANVGVSAGLDTLVISGLQGGVVIDYPVAASNDTVVIAGQQGVAQANAAPLNPVSGVLNLNGYVATITSHVSLTSGAEALAITGHQGEVLFVQGVFGGPRLLSISSFPGSIVSTANLTGGKDALAFTGYAGSILLGVPALIDAGAGAVNIVGRPGGNLTVGKGANANGGADTLTIVGRQAMVTADIEITGGTSFLSVIGEAGTSSAAARVTATATQAMTITGLASTLGLDHNIIGGPETVAITGRVGAIQKGIGVQAERGVLDITGYPATIIGFQNIFGAKGTLSFSRIAGEVVAPANVDAGPETITITGRQGRATAHANVEAGSQAFVITGYSGEVVAPANANAPQATVISLGKRAGVAVADANSNAAGAAVVTITVHAASVTAPAVVEAGNDNLSFTGYPASILANVALVGGVQALSLFTGPGEPIEWNPDVADKARTAVMARENRGVKMKAENRAVKLAKG